MRRDIQQQCNTEDVLLRAQGVSKIQKLLRTSELLRCEVRELVYPIDSTTSMFGFKCIQHSMTLKTLLQEVHYTIGHIDYTISILIVYTHTLISL